MYDCDLNESVDCSPVQQRFQKTLIRRNRRKLYEENNKIDADKSDSIIKSRSSILETNDSSEQYISNSFNILHEVHLMAKSDYVPAIEKLESNYSNCSEIFLTASQFRDNILCSNNVQTQFESPVTNLLNENPNNISSSYSKCPTNKFSIDIFNDFTEIEDNNSLSPSKNNLSPPPFRYKRKYLRTYNGPTFKSSLVHSPESIKEIEIDSGSEQGSDLNLYISELNSIPLIPIKLNSNVVKSSQNISKNILDLSLMYLNSSTYSIDSLNFEHQNSLESNNNICYEVNQDDYINKAFFNKELFEFEEKNDLKIMNLEEEKMVDSLNSKHILKVKHETEHLNVTEGKKITIRKSQRLVNSKSKHMKIKNKKNKSMLDLAEDSQYLTPISEFLNESNERQLRIYEKLSRISAVFNSDTNSDNDEDFFGFDNSKPLSKEDKESSQIYTQFTQRLLNKYLEEDLDIFDSVDDSDYSIQNSIKNGTMNIVNGETQSLLNDSFMDCPNVLKDVDFLLNRSKSNKDTKKTNNIDTENFINSEFWADEDIFKDIKTQNFIKEYKNIKENLRYIDDINFKTPTRPSSQTKLKKLLNNENVMNKPELLGFKSGKGVAIKISNEALKHATNFMLAASNEIATEEKVNKNLEMREAYGSAHCIGFLDSGKANVFKIKEIENIECSNVKILSASTKVPKKKVTSTTNEFNEINTNDPGSADNILVENQASREFVNMQGLQKSDPISNFKMDEITDKPLGFPGFRFVSGKKVQISDEAMKKANSILKEAYSEETSESAIKEITEPEPENIDCNQNLKENKIISKRKIDEPYEIPQKIFKNATRKQDTYLDSLSKLYSNDLLIVNTPNSKSVQLNLCKTPYTPANTETLSKFSTPNLADFYNSIIVDNKSTPKPGTSIEGYNSLYFDDLKLLNNTTNLESDLENSQNSLITPRRSAISPNLQIYSKPVFSPACAANNCKPSGLRKRRSKLNFSKGPTNI